MATTHSRSAAGQFDSAFSQLKGFNEQFLAATRKAGNVYLDTYEKAVDRTIEFEMKLAGLTRQEWLKGLIETQSDLAREITSSYTTSARTFLK
jgi:hypothetical protein